MESETNKVCDRIAELVSTIITNERVLDSMYMNHKEQDGVIPTVDFSTIRELEIQNKLMRKELNSYFDKK
jgi:hypothetical protein